VTITPIQTKRIYLEIVDQLADLITRGEFAPGQQLPSERELVDKLRVSRASLREALIALEIMGLIETKHGQGRFVRSDEGAPLLQFDSATLVGEESPFALLEARKILEPGIAALAARVRSGKDLPRIRYALELAEANLDDRGLRDQADRLFDLAIAAATKNPVIETIMELISRIKTQKLWSALEGTARKIPGEAQMQWAQHRAIYEAIKAKDEEDASRRMLEHLEEVERSMLLP